MEVFDPVPDPITRSALNEIFIPGACKTVLGNSYRKPPHVSENPGFPPEPSKLYCVTAAYVREGTPDGIKREFCSLAHDLPPVRKSVFMYEQTVGRRQDHLGAVLFAAALTKPELATMEGIRDFCEERVTKVGRRLLAAHFVAQVVRTGELIDALVMPRLVSEQLPMALLHSNRQPNPMEREAASVAAAAFLPEPEAFSAALGEAYRMQSEE
jgi:hypothetical protein